MTSQSTQEHREAAHDQPVACAVLTVSDTRTAETDQGGPLIRRLLTAAGHTIVDHAICRDEPAEISARLDQWIAQPQVQVILTTDRKSVV